MLTTQFVLVVCFIADREKTPDGRTSKGASLDQRNRSTGPQVSPRATDTSCFVPPGSCRGRCRRPRLELFCSFLKTWACRGFSAPCLLRPCSEAGAFGRRLSQLFCCKVGNTFMGGKRCSFLTQSSVLHASLWAFFWGGPVGGSAHHAS